MTRMNWSKARVFRGGYEEKYEHGTVLRNGRTVIKNPGSFMEGRALRLEKKLSQARRERTPLTVAEIDAARSPAGGWTRKTLAGWGVPWPPPKGWRRALLTGEPIPTREREK